MRFPTGGEGGIRTLDILRRTGFQDQRTRPTMRPLQMRLLYDIDKILRIGEKYDNYTKRATPYKALLAFISCSTINLFRPNFS